MADLEEFLVAVHQRSLQRGNLTETQAAYLWGAVFDSVKNHPWYKLHRLATADGRYGTGYECKFTANEISSLCNTIRIVQHNDGWVDFYFGIGFKPDTTATTLQLTPTTYTISDILNTVISFDANGVPAVLRLYSDQNPSIVFAHETGTGFSPHVRAYFPPGTLTIEKMQTGTADPVQPQENAYHPNENIGQQQSAYPPPENTGTGYGVQDNVGGDGGN